MNVTTEYLAIGANRHSSCSDWSRSGILAYGAGNTVALWAPHDSSNKFPRCYCTLKGHSGTVTSVQFHCVPRQSEELLLSASIDETLRVWLPVQNAETPTPFLLSTTSDKIGGALIDISAAKESSIIAGASSAGAIIIWSLHIDGPDFRLVKIQTLLTRPNYFPLSVAVSSLDSSRSTLILAVGGSRTTIELFVSDAGGQSAQFRSESILPGHEDWIRSLNFCFDPRRDDNLLLASASQDKYIRIWRCQAASEVPAKGIGRFLSKKTHAVTANGTLFGVTFESLLLEHEDWVLCNRWNHSVPGSLNSDKSKAKLQLLSTSADSSLAIWEMDEESSIWVCSARLGNFSATKGATTATGSAGGFWAGAWSPDGRSVACAGKTGAWRIWNYETVGERWSQAPAITGHVKNVTGLAWARKGEYLLSTGSDQTTRMHAPVESRSHGWREFARPQIHGYDLNCIDTISSTRFVSGADEKLLRVFDLPKSVSDMLNRIGGLNLSSEGILPEGANIPLLGLSNKAVNTVDENQPDLSSNDLHVDATAVLTQHLDDLLQPPLEDHLARLTLWPETEKLYGHGYEISAVAASNDGALIATTCKASSMEHAVIRMFDTISWNEITPCLKGHTLTVTSLEFSSDDRYLLSVGRDRQWTLHERSKSETYELRASQPKAHSRMIIDCSWGNITSSGRIFATAGRDKSVKVWSGDPAGQEWAHQITIAGEDCAATAVCFQRSFRKDSHSSILAMGYENGAIILGDIECSAANKCLWKQQYRFDTRMTPDGPITRLSWQPHDDAEATYRSRLACASEDCSVRIYQVTST